MLFTEFREYEEHGYRSKIFPTVLGAIFKEKCDARHVPFSWKIATLYRQIDQPRQTESFLIACISLVNEPDKYARAHAFPQVKYTCI